jgi:hypothetical protein
LGQKSSNFLSNNFLGVWFKVHNTPCPTLPISLSIVQGKVRYQINTSQRLHSFVEGKLKKKLLRSISLLHVFQSIRPTKESIKDTYKLGAQMESFSSDFVPSYTMWKYSPFVLSTAK